MTKATYLQRGEALDFINTTDETIPAGVVIPFGKKLGVTGSDTPPGNLGSLHVMGVFEIAKTGTAAIEMGTPVFFDGTGITDTSGADTTPAGYAAAYAAADAETLLVQLNG